MEKNIHRVRLRVFFREDEDINTNYKKLMPFDDKESEKIEITNKNSQGLIIREAIITKNKLCDKFFKNLIDILGENKEAVLKELDLYIDEQFYDFYIRLDKETLAPVTGGGCYHIKITPAAFPKTKENVKKKILKLFEN